MNPSKKKDPRFWDKWRRSGAVASLPSLRLIADLPATAENKAVYRRSNGRLFIKLNERFHVATKLSEDGKSWLGAGFAEAFNPNERVVYVA